MVSKLDPGTCYHIVGSQSSDAIIVGSAMVDRESRSRDSGRRCCTCFQRHINTLLRASGLIVTSNSG